MQRRFTQAKVHFKFFDFVRIKTIHKPSKVAVAKNFFPVYVKDATCLDEWLLFHAIVVKKAPSP